MNITNVKIKLVNSKKHPELKAFAAIVLDDEFIIYNLRVIRKDNKIFTCMPDNKKTFRCSRCERNNTFDAYYCTYCGDELPERQLDYHQEFIDVCHPLNQKCRYQVNAAVLCAYCKALEEGVKDVSLTCT